MFYTTITGWLLAYTVQYASGTMMDLHTPEAVGAHFSTFTASASQAIPYLLLTTFISAGICALGVQNGVEKIIKYMMIFLLFMLFFLAARALTMPGTGKALAFYLKPDISNFMQRGPANVIFDAMGQAFFTLSIGIGSMEIFGSYIDKKHSLGTESIWIIALDTLVALMAGLIIFPICFSYNVDPGSGPALIFVSLPNIFTQIPGGRFWGLLFFAFLSAAALTTVIAVFENMIAFLMDELHFSRKKASFSVFAAISILSLPCTLGFGILKNIHPMGESSSILDLEDFIVSNNLLPLGALFLVFFCTLKRGWGWHNMIQEANTGKGIKLSGGKFFQFYVTWVLPLIILFVFFMGYYQKFFQK